MNCHRQVLRAEGQRHQGEVGGAQGVKCESSDGQGMSEEVLLEAHEFEEMSLSTGSLFDK